MTDAIMNELKRRSNALKAVILNAEWDDQKLAVLMKRKKDLDKVIEVRQQEQLLMGDSPWKQNAG